MRTFLSIGALLAAIACVNAFTAPQRTVLTHTTARTHARGGVMMARNPMKTLKVRRRRVKAHEGGRLRLSVFRSNNHIYGQVINDLEHHTVAAVSSVSLKMDKGNDKTAAFEVGKALGAAAKEKGIEKVFFDRESKDHKYLYHGRVASLVDGVREAGMAV